ncbi:GPI ethanolamine phosphate transferase 1-like [Artemia franciscana]|uniref:GPI ethanolamine phosphate transferase 1-like n=1 Tax=Artemia franciscana TaxID=6661 RepID=UPI0032DA3CCE
MLIYFKTIRYLLSDSRMKRVIVIQLLLILMSLLVKFHSSSSVEEGQGLPLLNQIFSWFTLGFSVFSPLLSDPVLVVRLYSISLSFLPSFILLSLTHEVLFYVCFCLALFSWVNLDGNISKERGISGYIVNQKEKSALMRNDLKIAFLYMNDGKMLLLVQVISDFMGLQFFYMVTNTGSWLDIGTSISHFVIVELTVLFILLLNILSNILVRSSINL